MPNEIIFVFVFVLILIIFIACSNLNRSRVILGILVSFVVLTMNIIAYKKCLAEDLKDHLEGKKPMSPFKLAVAEKMCGPVGSSVELPSESPIEGFTPTQYDTDSNRATARPLDPSNWYKLDELPPKDWKQPTGQTGQTNPAEVDLQYKMLFENDRAQSVIEPGQADQSHGVSYDQDFAWQAVQRGLRGRRNAVGRNVNRVQFVRNRFDLTGKQSEDLLWWDAPPKKWMGPEKRINI